MVIVRDGQAVLALRHMRIRAVVECSCIVRLQLDRVAEIRDRLVMLALVLIRDTAAVVRHGKVLRILLARFDQRRTTANAQFRIRALAATPFISRPLPARRGRASHGSRQPKRDAAPESQITGHILSALPVHRTSIARTLSRFLDVRRR